MLENGAGPAEELAVDVVLVVEAAGAAVAAIVDGIVISLQSLVQPSPKKSPT